MTSTILDGSVLTYFPICGRGECVRLLLEDNKVSYTDEGMGDFTTARTDLDKYAFGQLPRLKLSNEKTIVQSLAILEYAAKVLGKAGSGDLDEDVKVLELNYAVEDSISAYLKAVYNPDHAAMLVTFATTHVDRAFKQFEHLLSESKPYFVYDYPSFPEYHLLYLTFCVLRLRPSALDAFPKLSKWQSTILARKGIKNYLESGRQFKAFNGQPTADNAVC